MFVFKYNLEMADGYLQFETIYKHTYIISWLRLPALMVLKTLCRFLVYPI